MPTVASGLLGPGLGSMSMSLERIAVTRARRECATSLVRLRLVRRARLSDRDARSVVVGVGGVVSMKLLWEPLPDASIQEDPRGRESDQLGTVVRVCSRGGVSEGC